MADYKYNIFSTLTCISKKDSFFFTRVSEEERKAMQPYVLLRWMSGTSNKNQLMLLNEIVNPYVFSLQQHKDLVLNLMTVCGTGKSQKFNWIKQKSSKGSKMNSTILLICQHFNVPSSHAYDIVNIMSDDDILKLASEMGHQEDYIKNIKKELASRKK